MSSNEKEGDKNCRCTQDGAVYMSFSNLESGVAHFGYFGATGECWIDFELVDNDDGVGCEFIDW